MVSGFLLFYELLGARPTNTPIAWLGVKITNPEAAVFVIFILLLYFAFRLIIEWWKLESEQRMSRPLQIDYILAHSIAALAVFLFLFQSMQGIQIAESIMVDRFSHFGFGFVLAALLFFWFYDRELFKGRYLFYGILLLSVVTAILQYSSAALQGDWNEIAVFAIGFVLSPLIFSVIFGAKRILEKKDNNP